MHQAMRRANQDSMTKQLQSRLLLLEQSIVIIDNKHCGHYVRKFEILLIKFNKGMKKQTEISTDIKNKELKNDIEDLYVTKITDYFSLFPEGYQ